MFNICLHISKTLSNNWCIYIKEKLFKKNTALSHKVQVAAYSTRQFIITPAQQNGKIIAHLNIKANITLGIETCTIFRCTVWYSSFCHVLRVHFLLLFYFYFYSLTYLGQETYKIHYTDKAWGMVTLLCSCLL